MDDLGVPSAGARTSPEPAAARVPMSRHRSVEAVVLRGVRYGEADRVVTVLSAEEGHLAVFARGVRRPRSRIGGRLEPFGRVHLELVAGRGGMPTVTGATLVDAHHGLQSAWGALEAAGRAAVAADRLLADAGPVPLAHGLLCTWLHHLARAATAAADPGWVPPEAAQVAFALKLLTAVGLGPELDACASCGAADADAGFDPGHGGVVCPRCAAGARAFGPDALALAREALALPLRELPDRPDAPVAELERATRELAARHLGATLPRPVRRPRSAPAA